MKLLICFVLVCLVATSFALPRIHGGKIAEDGKYPYQVSMRVRRAHYCGGSIINDRWILVAAHCLDTNRNVSQITIMAGTNLLFSDVNEKIYQAEHTVYHKDYNPAGLINDIGLIRVNETIKFNDRIQPISLPKEDLNVHGYPVTLTGWGKTETEVVSKQLKVIELKLVDQQTCADIWYAHEKSNITESHICTLTRAGEGACNDDSGSPLVADGIQVGIVSYGDPCALGWPDVYTRVYTFLDWIAEEQAKFD